MMKNVFAKRRILQKFLFSNTFGNKNMPRFTHIIFDLDGTLTDPRQGIRNAIAHALNKMNTSGFNGIVPDGFIGPPLQQGFSELFGLNGHETELAVEYFREYYSARGLFENQPYPGVMELLQKLDYAGKNMFLATSKLEAFAVQICEHFGFSKYIIQLKGADYKGEKATKTTIISDLLEMQKLLPSKKTVMIGDTVFDVIGGKQNDLSTIAVTYGFGKAEELLTAEPDFWAENVDELYEILMAE
jgi:phosphoglycolate phosphatase